MMVSRTALAAALVLVPAQAALALDAEDFGAKFRDALLAAGISVEFDRAQADGTTIVLSDFILDVPGEDPITLEGDLTFSGVTETGDGGYRAETATIADVDTTDEETGLRFQAADILGEGIWVPADVQADLLATMLLYERFSAGPLSLELEGEETLSIGGLEFWAEGTEDRSELTSGYSLRDGVFVMPPIAPDELTEEDEEFLLLIDSLGLDRIGFSLEGEGRWNTVTGEADFEDLSFVFEDLGALSLSGRLTGYTLEFHTELMELQERIAVLGPNADPEEMHALELEAMNRFGQLEIVSLTVRYDDDSLVPRALEVAGEQQGVDGPTLAAGLGFMVPMILAEMGDPEFADSAAIAAETFLADPQNLVIEANPPAPVRISDLVKASEDPALIIGRLGLTVTANQ